MSVSTLLFVEKQDLLRKLFLTDVKFNRNRVFKLYFYRDSNKNKIDLIIETAETLFLFKIKMRYNINKQGYIVIEKFNISHKNIKRIIITSYENFIELSTDVKNLP